ncbi:hypothetical protein [Streptomyces sp. AP-93]|uniref:hypothetical protein n=1 Tax=Streptomyces sp. AP-93 TaxID=2929048 RepID=UPI001FAE877A|nr:hypothetical protein [Streptomyces sp. AP-93]MCJ0869299.1 hypothetical protein [Streptomyces sp. AP-93]
MTEPAVIFVNDGMFAITGGSVYSVESADWSNALAAPMDHGAFILTGIHTGLVNVQTLITSTPPPADTAGWEEVVEVSVHADEVDLALHYFQGEGPDEPPALSNQGPGWYRMRVHARGRDLLRDGVSEEPVEDYLLTAWPQQPTTAATLRTSQRIDQSLRDIKQA